MKYNRIAIVGLLGSGKTLLMTLMLYKAHMIDKMKVLTNYHTTFSRVIDHREIDRFEIGECALGLDELATIIDSRNPPIKNVNKTYAFLQSRKRETKIVYTTQGFMMVDTRLRLITDIVYVARNLESKRRFEYTPWIAGIVKGKRKIRLPYSLAKDVFPLYDHQEIVMPITIATEENVDWEDIIQEKKDAPTKQAFIGLMKTRYPLVSESQFKSVYDYLEDGKDSKAREIIYSN